MTATTELDIASLDRIDYTRPHREETRDLACKLSPAEYEGAGDAFAKAVRVRETLELEAQQEAKRRKGVIEAALGEERRLLKILETHYEDRPTKVKEMWAKRNGEDVLVSVRLDLFTGCVDSLCYVGTRFPQPMDRQTHIKPTSVAKPTAASAPGEENLHRQADAAFASLPDLWGTADAAFAPPTEDSEAQPFEDEADDGDDRSLIPMEGAADPEVKGEAKPKPKRSRKESTAAVPALKAKAKVKAK